MSKIRVTRPRTHPPCGQACGGSALRALHCTCPKSGFPSPEGVTLHRPVRSAGIMKSKTPERPERLTPSLFGTRPDGEHSLCSPRGPLAAGAFPGRWGACPPARRTPQRPGSFGQARNYRPSIAIIPHLSAEGPQTNAAESRVDSNCLLPWPDGFHRQ